MLKQSVQVMMAAEPAKTQARNPYVAWRPSVERAPQFNPFSNLVDDLSGAPLVNRPMIRGASAI